MFPKDEFTFSEVMEYADLWGVLFKVWINENFKASDILNMIEEDGLVKTTAFITEKYENKIREYHDIFGIEEVDCLCTNALCDISTRNTCADEADFYGKDLEEMCANCDLKCYGCERIKTKDKPFEL